MPCSKNVNKQAVSTSGVVLKLKTETGSNYLTWMHHGNSAVSGLEASRLQEAFHDRIDEREDRA